MTEIDAILCMDIDGTLIDHNDQIHAEDVRILNDFPKTIQPVLTTGRPLVSAKGILQANRVYQDDFLPLPGVFMNGGAAYLSEEVLFLQNFFPEDVLQTLRELSDSFPQSTFAFFKIDKTILVNPTPFGRYIANLHYLSASEKKSSDVPAEINKMMVIEQDTGELQAIMEGAHGIEAEISYSLPFLLEFSPTGVNKASPLFSLLRELALIDLPIYAVGDGQNDLGLFNEVNKSFAPSTAHPAILKKADHIIQREDKGLLTPIFEKIYA